MSGGPDMSELSWHPLISQIYSNVDHHVTVTYT